MKSVILAAGLGSRLSPITNEVPKCMVPVNGIRIIDKQIDNLTKNGINDIAVVAGYKSDILVQHIRNNYPFVHVIENPDYSATNNMYSLYLSSDFVKNEEFILMNGDVYFDSNVIAGLLLMKGSAIACDKKQFIEESMKVTVSNGVVNHISKKINESDAFAVSIDVYKISKESGTALFDNIKTTIEIENDRNSWTEVALDQIFNKTTFIPYIIEGRWFEIDNFEDLSNAEKLFENDIL